MSLLLDALKKAADDKQKASQSDGAATDEKNKSAIDVEETQVFTGELSLQAIDDPQDPAESLSIDDSDYAKELTLEIDEAEAAQSGAEDISINDITLDEMISNRDDELDEKETHNLHQQQNKKAKDDHTGRLTVSDDALSMLIYKTNRDVKRGRRVLIFSVFIASAAIIVIAGIYYYFDMQAEIASLERKHQIEMLSMQEKTSREKTPEKTAIIRNLVSDSNLDEKVQYAKNIANVKLPSKTSAEVRTGSGKNTSNMNAATGTMSVHKTNKTDPVGEKLDAAWQAYEGGQYSEAELLYKNVLNIEENNRDALLGLGAIAVIEKNNQMARDIYLSLLKLDPRDPIATAAMASLQSDESSLKSDEEYMLAMQQKNPDAPHLNFALGNIYAQQDKWKSAQQYYFNAWQNDIENADYIYNLAVSMDQLNKSQQAISFYKDSLLKSANKQVSFSREAVQKRINELSGL